ncbi:S-layer homology domain-containing protein [Bacillus thermotolerans]|uniref:S-layer homology domain-containing protein n=1 Tax=Bacillus thermotolerans TaxID=1221996 RepID=UPI000591D6AA|nr:S-layer homology domain-containing protein [Bacillus thermotolerans]KKB40405.1 hypothetical protein QY96_02405 [Bacillus thermotolerans]
MKLFWLKAGVLALLAGGLAVPGHASADIPDWASSCAAYGELEPGENPSFQHANCLLTSAALDKGIPPEVVKAVATQEKGDWKQFEANGKAVVSGDNGIGIMQITNQTAYNQERLKTDIYYNIEKGIEILDNMYRRADLPKIKGAGKQVIENWYFPVMAYNGIKPTNSPLKQATGEVNTGAYQEEVFAEIEKNSFLGDTELADFPFTTSDFGYEQGSTENIQFLKKEYIVTEPTHESVYLLKEGDKVVVTDGEAGLRQQNSTAGSKQKLAEFTRLLIDGDFTYDERRDSFNHFVWFPVKTMDGKQTGYIPSAYIEKLTFVFPDVSTAHRFYREMYSLNKKGIIQGLPDGTFAPDKTVTRAQAAIMISRALDLPLGSGTTPFSDVSTASESGKHIAAAYKKGIIQGFEDGKFHPGETVTREQMAIFLARAFELEEKASVSFSDVASGMKAYESIQKILAAGITEGYENNTFRPTASVTRAQLSAFLFRALDE